MIHMEWYRVFFHTARSGNLTRAAEQLHLTQPSVSYAIKQLEQSLGVVLFHRQSKGVVLTEEGEALLRYVEQSMQLLDAAEHHMQQRKQLQAGEIRIGASDSLIKHLLLPPLNTFHRTYPALRIRLSHGKTPDLTKRLKDGAIDCAVLHLPWEDEALHIVPLAALEECFVVGEANRHLAAQPLTIAQLAQLPLLLLSPGSSTRMFVEQWFASHGLTIQPDMELGSVELLTEFAIQGYGIALLSRPFIQDELAAGKLHVLQLEETMPQREVGLAVRRDSPLSVAASQFVELLLAQLKVRQTPDR